jgi:hypothetical protein
MNTKKLLMVYATSLTVIQTALSMPLELIDLNKLDSPNSMTEGLLPEVYYGMLGLMSRTWKWFLIIITIISLAIIIILLGRFFKRIFEEHI